LPQFYFDLRSDKGVERDASGLEFPSLEMAYLDAFRAAQAMWVEMLATREDPTVYTFEISDAEGRWLLSLPFSEVLDTTRRGGRTARPSAPGAARKHAEKTLVLVAALREQIERSRAAVEKSRELLNGAVTHNKRGPRDGID
jgi:hypothetical protein